MSASALDPKHHIDRAAEKEIFKTLLKLADDARVLAIRDKGGMGKSSLLKWFDYECRWGDSGHIPSTLTILSEFADHTPFGLIAKIRREFGEDDSSHLEFPRFDELDYARMRRSAAPFGPRTSGRGTVVPNLVTGGTVVGSAERIYAGSVGTVNEAAPTWPTDLEDRARRACVNAFFDDLREISAEHPFVLILDAFEHCREPLRSWLRDGLVRARIVASETRCHGLVVVVAGREMQEVSELPDEVQKRVVRSVESLSKWETEHVRDFLMLHGISPTDNDVNFIQEKLGDSRLSLVDVLQLVQLLKA